MQSSKADDRYKKIEEAAIRTSLAEITGRARPVKEIRLLHRQLNIIREFYKKLVYSREQITSAYEWLYDNYYILEREGRQVIKELWRCCALPQTDGETLVRLHAGSLCESAAGALDAQSMEYYIEAVQKNYCLESCELSAFSLMLRAALIDGASRACMDEMSDTERERLFSDAIKTLNFLTTFDFSQIVERQSRLEQILAQDPAGIYLKMDERSRAVYRTRLARIARHRRISETRAAEMALDLAKSGETKREQHVGFYILDRELDRPRPSGRGRLYLMLLWLLPAVVSIALGFVFRLWWLPLLLFIPLWEVIRPITDFCILKGVPATFLPRMELEGNVPDDAPTLVVVSTLLTSPQKAEEFSKKLEQFYYSNGRGNIMFGILADLKEAKLPEQPEDKAMRAAAVKQVRSLNRKYGNRFCLFVRSRRFNNTQGGFSGWERKRGAIIELIRMIKGQSTSISTFEGDLLRLKKTRYIITLDADTGLIMDTAAEMVSAAMHPLNVPCVENGIVTRGFGILAPRISVDLESAAKTPFSRVMAGAGGVTAYDNAAGDIYQDIFGEGIFAGKGIIDVDAFYEVLDHSLPENSILSHDILEGCFMRAGYLSDVELTDSFPARPAPWFDRIHRWIRGDWQNIGFIFSHLPGGQKTLFNAISRFKLADNLRRSITPVFAFACLVAAAFLPLGASLLLIITAFLSLSGAGLLSIILAVARGGPSMLSRKYHCRVMPQTVNSLAQGALAYLFLPHHALVAADAAVRAIFRRSTGKNLLEWVTAAETESQKDVRHNAFLMSLRRFWPSFAIGAAFLLLAPQTAAKFAGAFFLITPIVAWLSGIPTPPIHDELSDDDAERLRSYTAAMWRYYEDYVTSKDNFLPPDNFQEAPVSVLAHRTSPTNIGLLLLSTLAARDLKLIDGEAMFERIEATISTVERLEKWKGHLYNWYNTLNIEPLRPAYVSTVDSGNLLCCLVTLREGLKDYTSEYDGANELCTRITKLVDDTDLAALYNRHRRLFHIGYDVEKKELSEIYYDLLMSEARMTSYYAVAKRIAPKRHWGVLGRTLTRQNGYTGPISWTGTMFEYMMPHLLLPVYEDSMAAEALRFVIFCQMRRVKEHGLPWGISESGFYSFDAALNYQYEANGVQKLALKRGMDDGLVISPYSTFLALPFNRVAGIQNLIKL
jgi:cyclic beta-1,2-glucan synthetase